MKALNEEQLQRYKELREAVEESKGEIEQAIEEYNSALEELPNIDGTVDEFNQTVADFNEFCTEVAGDIETYCEERREDNEDWDETSEGEKCQQWFDTWEEEMDEADSYLLGETARPLSANGLPKTPTLPTSLTAL